MQAQAESTVVNDISIAPAVTHMINTTIDIDKHPYRMIPPEGSEFSEGCKSGGLRGLRSGG